MRAFFDRLNYASVNEDWRTEIAAVRPAPDERLLCVTGSGARPLDLLIQAPMTVIAIDLAPAQNHLLALKVAALRSLPFEDYAAFLGLHAADPRWRRDRLRELAPSLAPDARAYWDRQAALVAGGVIYQGRWERHCRRMARLAAAFWPRVVRALFQCDDLIEQRRLVAPWWRSAGWRAFFAAACHPWLTRALFGDPGHCPARGLPLAPYAYRRMGRALGRWLARENFMLGLLLRGELPAADLPPHLTPQGAAVLHHRLDRLEIVTADVGDYLEQVPAGSFTRFSLSDVASYLSAEGFRRLVGRVVRAAAPGARVCLRQYLTRYSFPNELADRLRPRPDQSRALDQADRSFAYELMIADVTSSAT